MEKKLYLVLAIELENAAMQSPSQVANLLVGAADRIEAGESSFRLADLNGNTVGRVSRILADEKSRVAVKAII